jgi:hypothetical protein
MITDVTFGLIEITREIIKQNRVVRSEARKEKAELIVKMESAKGEELFKFMNLISFTHMDEFASETRLHAQQSFNVCLYAGVGGFIIIVVSIAYAIIAQSLGNTRMEPAYLGSSVGLISEAIAAIFFSLYGRASDQVNRLHDRLLGSQSMYAAVLATSLMQDAKTRESQLVELSSKIMERTTSLDKE